MYNNIEICILLVNLSFEYIETVLTPQTIHKRQFKQDARLME